MEAARPDATLRASGHRAASDAPPLTRAAARRRIEQMDPIVWLSRYGTVAIDPIE